MQSRILTIIVFRISQKPCNIASSAEGSTTDSGTNDNAMPVLDQSTEDPDIKVASESTTTEGDVAIPKIINHSPKTESKRSIEHQRFMAAVALDLTEPLCSVARVNNLLSSCIYANVCRLLSSSTSSIIC